MINAVFWIHPVEGDWPSGGRLGTMARPRGGEWLEDEIWALKRAGVSVLVSALEWQEVRELGLEAEAGICQRLGVDFVPFPIPDVGVPDSMRPFGALVQGLAERCRRGQSVVVHCRMGIGRASMIGAGVLGALGLPIESAWERIGKSRGLEVPDTKAQARWVERAMSLGALPW